MSDMGKRLHRCFSVPILQGDRTMRRVNIKIAALVALLSTSPLLAADDKVRSFPFGSAEVGKVPSGWKADKTGKGEGSVWKVVADKTAPSGKWSLWPRSPRAPAACS